MPKTAQIKKRNEEKAFFWFALGLSVPVGIGFCALLYAVSHRNPTPESFYDSLPDTPPVVIQPDHPRQLVNFSLTNQTGHAITRADLNGKFLVVSFLFTSCSLTCPIVSRQMEEIQQLTTNQPDVQLVSLTVDPEDDTVPVLAQYGERYGADTNRWLFLTGDEATVEKLIGTSFLSPDTNDLFSFMPGNFANIERIAVVGPQGKVRAYFDGLNNNVATAVVAEINRLRK
ncbi:MAG TPA: SCO family protein [Candidatus Aquilonibacter sp.]|nr:SCO family protein [Candidatus Aquilonibacter sp.]